MNDIKPPRAARPLPRPVITPATPAQDAPGTFSPTPPPVYTPEKRRWALILISILAFICIAGAAGAWFLYTEGLKPVSSEDRRIPLVVEKGDTWDDVITSLSPYVIKSGLSAKIYIRLNKQPDLKAGTYMIPGNKPLPDILAILAEGKVDMRRITILPGKTLKELGEDLIKQGYEPDEVQKALSATYSHPLLAEKPAGASLEGYIFPETYFAAIDEPLETVITRSFDEFQKRLTAANIRSEAGKDGFNLYQALIFASIIEREVGKSDDRRQVAQVLIKRYKDGMVLGADATYEYAAKMMGVTPSPSLDSPYNTRKVPGLPPGPISTVPLSALEAFINPAAGDYLYYVSGDDGVTHFSRTLEEHEEKTRKYCTKACFSIE